MKTKNVKSVNVEKTKKSNVELSEKTRSIERDDTGKIKSFIAVDESVKPEISDVENVANEPENLQTSVIAKIKSIAKITTEPKTPKTPKTNENKKLSLVDVMSVFLNDGVYTKQQIIDMAIEKLPHIKPVSVTTLLTDCKNPKYNKFPFPGKCENGIYSFCKPELMPAE
jgi:hypothetical protein